MSAARTGAGAGAGAASGFLRGAAAVAVATLGVRCLGLVKEGSLAATLGSSAEMDALSLALLLPGTAGALLAGSLPLALIPAYCAARERRGAAAAEAFFKTASTVATLSLFLLSVLASLASLPLARALVSSERPETIERTAALLRALAFVLGASGLVAVLRSRLFASDRFFLGAVGPAIVSLSVLLAVATGLARTAEDVAWAILAGYGAKAAFLALALRSSRLPVPLAVPRRGTGAAAFFLVSLPIVVGAGVVSMNGLVDQAVASRLGDGSVSSLRFADQILQIPIALVAMAVSTAVLPQFSRQASGGDIAGLRDSFSAATRTVLLVALPFSAVLVSVPDVVVSVLFERGAFDAAATAAAAAPLRIYGLALPFLAYGYVNGRAYNALGENRVLVKVALLTLGANLVLDLLLAFPFGTRGIAAATVLSQGGAALLLFVLLEKRVGPIFGADARRAVARTLASSVALGILLALVRGGVPGGGSRALVVLAAAVPAGLALGVLFHRAEIAAILATLRRRS